MSKSNEDLSSAFVLDCANRVNLRSIPDDNMFLMLSCSKCEDLCNRLYFTTLMLLNLNVEDKKLIQKIKNWAEHRAGVLGLYSSCLEKKRVNKEEFDEFKTIIKSYTDETFAMNEIVDKDYVMQSPLYFYMKDNEHVYERSLDCFRDTDAKSLARKIVKDYGSKVTVARVDVTLDEVGIRHLLERHAIAIKFSYIHGASINGVDKIDTDRLREKLSRTGKKGICIGMHVSGRVGGDLFFVSNKSGTMKSDMFDAVTLDSIDELSEEFRNKKNTLLRFITLK